MTFKIDGRKFLLTYTHCTLSKEVLLSHLQAIGEVKYYTVAIEPHQDGTPHLHAAVHFSKKCHSTNSRYFDTSCTHARIDPLKLASDFEKASAYCRKHGDFISNVEERVSKRTALAKRLLDHGKIDREFITENPEIIFTNFSSIQSWLSVLGPKRVKIDYPTSKKRHFWLFGPSNSGKTTFLRKFVDQKLAVEIPTNDDYFANDETEVLWADEYKGHLTVQALNKLCDGNTQLNRKGGSVHIMFPIIFVCSNFSIRDCYSKINDDLYETLLNRFNEYDLSTTVPPL